MRPFPCIRTISKFRDKRSPIKWKLALVYNTQAQSGMRFRLRRMNKLLRCNASIDFGDLNRQLIYHNCTSAAHEENEFRVFARAGNYQ